MTVGEFVIVLIKHSKTGSGYSDKQFARYHSRTDDAVKEFLLSGFTNENDIFKVSIATIAFDMGVDCKRFHTVVHVPPSIL